MSIPRLIVFTRYPEPGKAKTRLIPALGAEGAARLHRELTAYTLEQADALRRARPVDVEVRCCGGSVEAMAELYGGAWSYRDQGEGDLGERLARAAAEAFDEGRGPVVIIGTDCPGLTADVLGEAFDLLASTDVVIGPAADGGYYLIGMRRPAPALFENIPWGTGEVASSTLRGADASGLTRRLLVALRDIDRPEDLELLTRISRVDRFSGRIETDPAPGAR